MNQLIQSSKKYTTSLIQNYANEIKNLTLYLGSTCFLYLFDYPLKLLYFNGPSMWGIGFWEGKNYEEICSHLTNVQSSFWLHSFEKQEMCLNIIEKKYNAFSISLLIIIYFIFLFYSVKNITNIFFEKCKSYILGGGGGSRNTNNTTT